MAHSKPQLTRELAQQILGLDQVDELIEHDTSSGKIRFTLENSLSQNRLNRMLPDGWTTNFVVISGDVTTAYIERRR